MRDVGVFERGLEVSLRRVSVNLLDWPKYFPSSSLPQSGGLAGPGTLHIPSLRPPSVHRDALARVGAIAS